MSDDLPVQDERIDADCPCACHELGVADTCLSVCCALARKDKQIAASHELIMRLTEKMERATSALLSRDMRLGIAHEALRHALPRVGMPVDHDTRAKWREEMLAAMSALSQPREPTPSPASTTTVWYPGTDATMDLCPEHAIRLPCPACAPAALGCACPSCRVEEKWRGPACATWEGRTMSWAERVADAEKRGK